MVKTVDSAVRPEGKISAFDFPDRNFAKPPGARIGLRCKIRSGNRRRAEVPLKHLLLIAALTTLLAPVCATAQTSAAPPAPAKPTKVSFTGKIREDGRVILVEGRAWVVSNVEKLREHAGQSVSVKGLLDPITNEIHVVSMKLIRPPVSTARLGDSAFRR
jgi:hypothetical protein